MPSFLPHSLSTAEIRVLQEFRRLGADELALEQIRAIKHPHGGGESPAWSLVEKQWLLPNDARDRLTLNEKSREFLAYNPVPESDEA